LNKQRQFTCAGCGALCTTTSTQKEMEDEYQQLYNEPLTDADEEVLSCCDTCYTTVLKHMEKLH
jgi:hypothetical protein